MIQDWTSSVITVAPKFKFTKNAGLLKEQATDFLTDKIDSDKSLDVQGGTGFMFVQIWSLLVHAASQPFLFIGPLSNFESS